jgi:ActR/RegA family two-component response regulator
MSRSRRSRSDEARELALAFLGANNATDVHLAVVIDRHIARVLDAADGNLSLTADLLSMHRRTLQRYARRKRPTRRRAKRR